jgi:L-lactate dehydrogenase
MYKNAGSALQSHQKARFARPAQKRTLRKIFTKLFWKVRVCSRIPRRSDTLRFRFHLAKRLNVSASDVEALVLGEHGVSSVFVWSSARVGGRKVLDLFGDSPTPQTVREEVEREVRYANITIIEGIGASQYGIGMVSARIAEMILRDERAVIPVGHYNATFGVTLSLPSVIGREGVHRVLEPEMSDAEQKGLQGSAEAIKAALSRLSLKESRRRTA